MPQVTVYEVGPRDGLQNEARTLSTAEKLSLVSRARGLRPLPHRGRQLRLAEVDPQLADAAELLRLLPAAPGLSYVVLVPNAKGLERLAEVLARRRRDGPPVQAAVFLSASDTHNRKNLNRSVEESLRELEALVPAARAGGLEVRGYVSTVWGCPYEGAVDPARRRRWWSGCSRSAATRCRSATPSAWGRRTRPAGSSSCCSDARRRSSSPSTCTTPAAPRSPTCSPASTWASTDLDASIGGLGGCPYAPGASGNLATEDLVYMLHGMGIETGIDWDRLVAAGALAERLVGRPLPGKALRAALATAAQARGEG